MHLGQFGDGAGTFTRRSPGFGEIVRASLRNLLLNRGGDEPKRGGNLI